MTDYVKYVIIKRGGKFSEIRHVNDDDTIGKPVEISQVITDGVDCYPWTEKYAWLPVKTIYGRYVWREKVFKRKVWVVWGKGFHMEPTVQYATMLDLLKGDPFETLYQK